MKQVLMRLIGGMGLVTLVGCAGTGEVIPLRRHIVPTGAEKTVKPAEPTKVAIGEFEDVRSVQTGLGVRTHLWGGVSYFDVPESKPAETVAHLLADYLTAKGWNVVKQGGIERADVVLTGKILELFVHAKSRVGSTAMTTKTKLAIQAKNSSDDSIVRMTLNGAGSEQVFWFDPEDLEEVVNEVLADSFGKLVQDTTVVNRMLRLTNP
ncbi:MAG: YajG family lipoprotein [Nitrospira sp.]|nr:YajG family lipoprotein [Nitrospira sp.]